jgi:hypothetical protein
LCKHTDLETHYMTELIVHTDFETHYMTELIVQTHRLRNTLYDRFNFANTQTEIRCVADLLCKNSNIETCYVTDFIVKHSDIETHYKTELLCKHSERYTLCGRVHCANTQA